MSERKFIKITEKDVVAAFKLASSGQGYSARSRITEQLSKMSGKGYASASSSLWQFRHLFYIDPDTKLWYLREDLFSDYVPPKLEVFREADKFLDKLIAFLTPKPDSSDFMIEISIVRDHLLDGVWDSLDNLLVLLEQKYGEEVKGLIEEGTRIRQAEGKGTKAIISEIECQEAGDQKEEVQEKNRDKVLEIM